MMCKTKLFLVVTMAAVMMMAGQVFAAMTVFFDDFDTYGTDKANMLAAGWEELAVGEGWGPDAVNSMIWGKDMNLRMITDYTIAADDEATITIDRDRPWSGYVYLGDIIAWDGMTATVLGSFSFDTTDNPVSYSTGPIGGIYAGQKLGFTFGHTNWGETNSIQLDVPAPREEPLLISPADVAIDVSRTPRLEWWGPEAYDAAGYRVYLDPNEAEVAAGAASALESDQGPDPEPNYYDVTPALEYGETYFWMVQAKRLPVTTPPNEPNWIDSGVRIFTTLFHPAQKEPGFPVEVENSSFELPGTVKQTGFANVAGWSQDVTFDSGVETSGIATDGQWHAYKYGPDGEIYQLLDYAIVAGETYVLRYDGTDTGGGGLTIVPEFYYLSNPADPTSRVVIATQSFPIVGYHVWDEFALEFSAENGAAYIGENLGIQFGSTGGWVGIDDVRVEKKDLRKAWGADPSDEAIEVPLDKILKWQAGVDPGNLDQTYPGITGHFVYLDPNRAAVEAADHNDTSGVYRGFKALGDESYDPSTGNLLAGDMTYYWRIDERLDSDPNVVKGRVWTFDTVLLLPIITNEPNSITVELGGTARFEVEVSSDSTPSFQWYKDGTPLLGKTEAMLELTGATEIDEGYYYCEVSNAASPPIRITEPARLMTRRLVAHWKFDDDMVDAEEGRNGTFVDPNEANPAPTPAYATGIVDSGSGGKAFVLPGLGKHVQMADPNFFNFYPLGYTVSAWVKTTQTSPWGVLVAKQRSSAQGGQAGWVLNCNGNVGVSTLRQFYYPDFSGSTTITDGEWHHVLGQYDAETGIIRIFTDGNLEGQSNPDFGPFDTHSFPVVVGAELTTGAIDLTGEIDDVKIWSYALSPVEVAVEYTNVKTDETICLGDPEFDFNNDCDTNIYDLWMFASKWLECYIVPTCIN